MLLQKMVFINFASPLYFANIYRLIVPSNSPQLSYTVAIHGQRSDLQFKTAFWSSEADSVSIAIQHLVHHFS
jgi:hypothetical protein